MTACAGLKLVECTAGESYYQLRYVRGSGRAKGLVRATTDGKTIASWTNKHAIMKHVDDPLIGLPYTPANKNKFATKFVPKY